jgi:hypothetical protein
MATAEKAPPTHHKVTASLKEKACFVIQMLNKSHEKEQTSLKGLACDNNRELFILHQSSNQTEKACVKFNWPKGKQSHGKTRRKRIVKLPLLMEM